MGFWGALAVLALLLLGPGVPFQLQETLRGLRGENARLEGTLRNLSRALGALRARLRDPPDVAWTQEPPPAEGPPQCHRGTPSGTPQNPPGTPKFGGLLLGLGVGLLLLLMI